MVQLVVRVPVELHQAMKAQAVREERTLSQVVRRAIRLYLEQPPS